jgi:probable HAF family extracellular repeat protein
MSRIQCVTVLAGLFAGLVGCDSPPAERLTEPETGLADAITGTAATVYYVPTYLSKTNGFAYDVNNKGQVVGFYTTSTGDRAFLWEKGVLKDLGTLGGDNAVAFSINDAGQIAGVSSLGGAEDHAFLWQNGVMKDLGTLGWTGGLSGSASEAVGVNARGQAAGWSRTSSGNIRAFLYEAGKMKRLTGLETTLASAYGIDSLGRVVGHLGGSTAPRAFRWQAGVLTKLGTLGGPTSKATAINNAGKIVGWATKASGAARAFLWQNGVMTDLGTLGGTFSEATAINKQGHVAGSAGTTTDEAHAFVWKSGVMADVGRGQAEGINDSGWVVGARVDPTVSGNGGYLPTLWRTTTTPPVPPPPGVVSVGNTFFISNRNFSTNPAVDTIPVGATFTWTWVGGGIHSVQSTGSPSFPSSALISTKGVKYKHTFTQKGTYQYNCIRHPGTMMGRVLVR